MKRRRQAAHLIAMTRLAAAFVFLVSASLAAQPADRSQLGPEVGAAVPPISGTDQFGRPQTLKSASGPNGAMLVFFRSADW